MTDTKHTDSVEAAEKEYQRQLAIATSVGEKYPHISAFIGAWDVYDGMMNDCYMTSKDRAQMRKMLTTLQATHSQQVFDAYTKGRSDEAKTCKGCQDRYQQQVEVDYNAGFRAGYEQCVKNQSQQVEEAVRKATKVATIEAWNDAIELSDQLEESNTKFDEWRAFKGFRNGLRDKIRALVETPNHQD